MRPPNCILEFPTHTSDKPCCCSSFLLTTQTVAPYWRWLAHKHPHTTQTHTHTRNISTELQLPHRIPWHLDKREVAVASNSRWHTHSISQHNTTQHTTQHNTTQTIPATATTLRCGCCLACHLTEKQQAVASRSRRHTAIWIHTAHMMQCM